MHTWFYAQLDQKICDSLQLTIYSEYNCTFAWYLIKETQGKLKSRTHVRKISDQFWSCCQNSNKVAFKLRTFIQRFHKTFSVPLKTTKKFVKSLEEIISNETTESLWTHCDDLPKIKYQHKILTKRTGIIRGRS